MELAHPLGSQSLSRKDGEKRKRAFTMDQKYIPVIIGILFLLITATIFVKPIAIKAILAIITVVLSGHFYSSCLSIGSIKK